MAPTPVMTQQRPNSTCTHSMAKKTGESDGISMPATLIGLSTISSLFLKVALLLSSPYRPHSHQRIIELLARRLNQSEAPATQCSPLYSCGWSCAFGFSFLASVGLVLNSKRSSSAGAP